MGVSLLKHSDMLVLTLSRISKTMGESFKLHSQALIGYVDEVNPDMIPDMTPMTSQPLVEVGSAY